MNILWSEGSGADDNLWVPLDHEPYILQIDIA